MTVQELLNAAQKLSLPDQLQLASQLMQVASQKLQTASVPAPTSSDTEDPLVGLFSGSVDLATRSKEILEQEIKSSSGFTWKES
ncbi:MAG: hypothetical protein DCF15_01590 [Phormidesmis priestleyi]|uniref:DUF2281 domain-containing protein n=1 Tax=Phormidesmis priestleyi TaxID=268141 RepID=A0A2W4XTG1_9CYAN|nr:MAG: hypothetical protein DCF15_01590 [Phormidesmis priestleyi]